MKRVLVTGGTGFIGRHVLPGLVERGFEVYAVSRSPSQGLTGVIWQAADLLADGAPEALIATVRPSHLLHLAWYTVPGQFWSSLENARWLASSVKLLAAFLAEGGQRFVGAGTCAEYDWRDGHCSEESTRLMPATVYGVAKHALRITAAAFARQTGTSAAWGRIFHLYGPGEHPDRLVASVVRSLLAGKPASCSEGSQIRDFLYVKDVAAAFVALIESDLSGPVNIASGQPVAVRHVVMTIAELIGRPELVRFGTRKADEPPRITADVTRLFVEMGWRPRYDLARGLRETIDWWAQSLRNSGTLGNRSGRHRAGARKRDE